MTRLMEALIFGTAMVAAWIRLITLQNIEEYISRSNLLLLPIFAVLIFGMASATIVLYRTFTFNNCPDAYEELKKEISDAKKDLEKKGFVFND